MAKATTTAQTHTDTDLPRTALLSQSDRTYQTEVALDTTKIEYETDPADPWAFDVLVIETPDRRMLKHVVEGQLKDTTVLFRMRGDPYWGINEWYDHPLPPVRSAKRYMALKQLEWVDGCVAIAPHQARKYRAKTGNETRIVQLSRDTDEWPDTVHADHELRALTLTNCMYPQKVQPIIDYAPAVEAVLSDVGGQWVIGGKGIYADALRQAVAEYDHIHFPGYVDAKARLREANIMLHLSQFDSFAGAILEGCASRLPVITTAHPAFTDAALPVDTINGSGDRLQMLLRRYAEPAIRNSRGKHNEGVIAERFNHRQLGQDWRETLAYFANA